MILDLLAHELGEDPSAGTDRRGMRGVSEETTTGVHRLYQMDEGRRCSSRRSTSTTRSPSRKFDNLYGCRHSLVDGLNRATDVMIGGKVAVVCGFGDVGKGCAQALRGQGCPRHRHRDRSDLRAAGGDGGLRGQDARGRARDGRHLRHDDGQLRHHHRRAHGAMKDKAIVGNIGHFDNEIDMAGLKKIAGIERDNIKPQYDEWRFPDGHSVLILAEGRLLNLGCATGHPSFVMSASFTNQVLAQIELAQNTTSTRTRSTSCRSTWTRRSPASTSTSSERGSQSCQTTKRPTSTCRRTGRTSPSTTGTKVGERRADVRAPTPAGWRGSAGIGPAGLLFVSTGVPSGEEREQDNGHGQHVPDPRLPFQHLEVHTELRAEELPARER